MVQEVRQAPVPQTYGLHDVWFVWHVSVVVLHVEVVRVLPVQDDAPQADVLVAVHCTHVCVAVLQAGVAPEH